jgi:hypothetical protein
MPGIADVKFGELDAESERNLAGFFVDTGVLRKLADGEKYLVLGRKGSGKTALFKLAQSQQLKQTAVLDVEFDKYPWQFHRQLKQSGMLAESAYEASWRFLFLLTIAKEWKEFASAPLKQKATQLVERIVPNPDKGVFASLLARMKNPTKVSLPGVTVGNVAAVTMGSIDLGKDDSSAAIGMMESHLDALTELVATNYFNHPIVVKVDRLDDGWDGSEDSKNLLVGELKAARSINQQLGREKHPAPIVTFLRTDIFEALRFNDKNKLGTATERLEWTDQRLMDVLNKRVAVAIDCDERDAWKQVFSTDEMLQRAKPNSYLTKRTMGRPRDIVAFAIHCRDVAMEAGHSRVETSNIYDAESRYSQHLLDELTDELHKQLPEIESYIECLREVGRTTFELNEWMEAAKVRGLSATEAEAKVQLNTLFEASVLGVPKIGGKERGSRYVYAYSERNVKPDFSRAMRVHPGLKKSLDLKEKRGGEGGEDTEDEVDFE